MHTDRPDHYAILGVRPDASRAEIDRAYRTLLRRHHPDTRARVLEADLAESDAMLQDVLAAYAVLRDPDRRADYDRRSQPLRAPSERTRRTPDLREQPPIVAGPVRWHRHTT